MRLRIKLLLATLAVAVFGVLAQANEYTAYKLASPPKLDGKADDPAWKGVPWAYGFRNLYEQYSYSQKQTAFKIGHDQDHLYLLLRCCEPEMAKIKTGERVQDGWPSKLDDLFFIFANSYNEQGTWQDSPFIIIQIGAGGIHRALDAKGTMNSPAEWRVAYHADDRNWFIETAIPLKFLGATPGKGGFFNVVRHLQTIDGGRNQKTSSWNMITNSKLEQHTLSPLILSPESGAADVAEAEGKLTYASQGCYGWSLGLTLGKIAVCGGEYSEAQGRLSNSPNWPMAEQARQAIEAVMKSHPGAYSGVGPKTDAYLDWQFALAQMADTSAPIRMEIAARDATAQVFLNGLEIKPESGVLKFLLGGDDLYKLLLADGANALTIAAKATGPSPGLRLKLPDFPETDGRWAAESAPAKDWQAVDFDDLKWARPTLDGQWIWTAPGTREACFRQLLIWSRNVYGGKLSSIVPPHVDYGFSPNTVEVFQNSIFPPTNQPMSSYSIQVELPAGFRLLDTKAPRSSPHSWNPSEVATKDIDVDGQPYRQYTLGYDVSKLNDAYTAMLPVKNEKHDQARKEAAFRFRRLINNNVTELTTTLPVHILPPVNGRRMKTILYPQYDTQFDRSVSPEVASELIKQGVAAGIDLSVGGQIVRDNGGRTLAGLPEHMPLWGAVQGTELYKLIQENPKYAATYFDNTGNCFVESPPYVLYFCFTHALGEGREAFAAALLKDYKEVKAKSPDAEWLFLNNENYPWHSHHDNTKPGKHCYCFCDSCKAEFRKSAGLPEGQPLSDQDIYAKHNEAWTKFWRHNQSGRLMELATAAAHDAGLKTIFYHNTHDKDAWREVAGKADLYNCGFPGNMSFVNRDAQLSLDDTMKFFASVGIQRLIGQLTTYFPFRSGRDGRLRNVNSTNGWALIPRDIKPTVVRMAATTHGGIVYESVMQFSGGSLYYFGEATRLIATYEALFNDGKREDSLAVAVDAQDGKYQYPDILVLTKGVERLILIFNETKEAKTLRLKNLELKPGQEAEIYGKPGKVADPAKMEITVPASDVAAIHIQ